MTTSVTPLEVQAVTDNALDQWNAWVRTFPNHRIVHTRAWIESLAAAGLGSPLYLALRRGGEVVACFPGLCARVGPWRLFGSPRAGWESVSMGPAFDPARVSTMEIFGAAIRFLETQYRVDYLEVMHPGLDHAAMQSLGFAGEPVATYRAVLHPGAEDRTFAAMKSSARRNIRRAERLGLELRFETDEAFVVEHYDQLREVYRRRGTAITFSRGRVAACFRHLKDAGNLIAVSVYLPGGRVSIASGMFFIEGRELSLWMWAHRDRYRWYRATEFMTWAVMRRAMEAGCDRFDFMGTGDFKANFGATLDHEKWRWMRSRTPWLPRARRVAIAGYRLQQVVRGRVARAVARLAHAWDREEKPSVETLGAT